MSNKKGYLNVYEKIGLCIVLFIIISVAGYFISQMAMKDKGSQITIPKSENFPVRANGAEQLRFWPGQIIAKPGKSVPVKISVYNDGSLGDGTNKISFVFKDCINFDEKKVGKFKLNTTSQRVLLDADTGFNGVIKIANNTPEDSYSCTITTQGSPSVREKLIFIQVTKP